jgi:translation initiation factor 1
MKGDDSNLVYSTASGSICPGCSRPVKNCTCRQLKKSSVPESGRVEVRFETSGRKGKGVTLISGLPLSQDDLLELSRKLKSQFATGGAVKGYVIELQGNQRNKALQELRLLGYLV